MNVDERAAEPRDNPGGADDGPVTSFLVMGTRFDVSRRYRLTRALGHGAYGVVVYVFTEHCPPARRPLRPGRRARR